MLRLLLMGYLLLAAFSAAAIVFTENGKAAASIVLCDGPTIAEQTAAKELAAYLGAVTGATFAIISESQGAGTSGHIFVGPTAFALAHGIDANALGPENGSCGRWATTSCSWEAAARDSVRRVPFPGRRGRRALVERL